MPTFVLAQKAAELSRNKQVIEAQLAKDIYQYFNKGEALQKLQTLGGRLLSGMLYGIAEAEAKFNMSAGKEGGLEVWGTIGGKNWVAADAFYKKKGENQLNASEVGDLIRLFGQWVEDGGLARPGLTGNSTDDWGQNLTNSSATKDAYRTGTPGGGAWKTNVESVWGDKKDRFKDVPTARRDRGDGWAIEPHIKDHMRNPTGFSGMAGVAVNQKGSKRAKGDSNVLKIDRLFGLVVGCDISGTTTDTAFALETQGYDLISACYYMLPLATIVHQNHHSLIEVALSLSLNGILDYHIGWYSTLKPLSVTSTLGGLSKEFAGLDSVLSNAETDGKNQHFLCHYRNGALAGAYVFSTAEAKILKANNVFKGTKLLQLAPGMPFAPTSADLDKLIASSGLVQAATGGRLT